VLNKSVDCLEQTVKIDLSRRHTPVRLQCLNTIYMYRQVYKLLYLFVQILITNLKPVTITMDNANTYSSVLNKCQLPLKIVRVNKLTTRLKIIRLKDDRANEIPATIISEILDYLADESVSHWNFTFKNQLLNFTF
jgi:hypothetical protein